MDYISFAEEAADAAKASGFSLFGMDTSNSINMIIASVAVLGFITSIIISIYTLKQSRKIGLFDKGYKVYSYIYDNLTPLWLNFDKPEKPDNLEELFEISVKIRFLFKRSKKLSDALYALFKYYKDGIPIPDYTKRLKSKHTVRDAFFLYTFNCARKIRKQLLL